MKYQASFARVGHRRAGTRRLTSIWILIQSRRPAFSHLCQRPFFSSVVWRPFFYVSLNVVVSLAATFPTATANQHEQEEAMRKITTIAAALVSVVLSSFAVGQDHATAQEVLAKVHEAASTLSKTHDLGQFNNKNSPWVWKDSYIYVVDCDKRVEAAHPIKPEMIGKSVSTIKDTKGNLVYPESFCSDAKKAAGTWIEYWWPAPGATEGSRKVSYNLGVEGTPYVVGAGIHDDKASVTELSKLTLDNK
jgi:hypothetical protein